ncbi:glycoside hydrolase family 16 protein [Streptomyces silvisoli]|uniref:Glycoside hydrolase family 16 protein n=1 Tax=Streptomyces silvisoli TaxID=3034235 RepID=A0ABT5ZM39_9ACTN|nr:glycoside hydrolase family 16 protein [Streptomyces silvisoli]MDF3290664.1 glycoside hydrolase family 16 protein [Streptomyces silvisoli]
MISLIAAALLGACAGPGHAGPLPARRSSRPTPQPTGRPHWHLAFTDTFNTPVPEGAFSDCKHHVDTPAAYCGGLPTAVATKWWAYPAGWPDTATQRHYAVGGYYDPATTLWISGGQLHIRMWRGATGPVHSATIVPKRLMGLRYGAYEERWRVSHIAAGYKSAHLLSPTDNDRCPNCEVDFPEGEWTGGIYAYAHHMNAADGEQDGFGIHATWGQWHTSRIEWTPGDLRFYLDGRLVGESRTAVPDTPADWDIQNESALNGRSPAPSSWAQMDIARVRGWSWD